MRGIGWMEGLHLSIHSFYLHPTLLMGKCPINSPLKLRFFIRLQQWQAFDISVTS